MIYHFMYFVMRICDINDECDMLISSSSYNTDLILLAQPFFTKLQKLVLEDTQFLTQRKTVYYLKPCLF
jgi:hypothetical protein